MKWIFAIALLVAAVAAGNQYNNNFNNQNDCTNRNNLTLRVARRQKFVIDLLRHFKDDNNKFTRDPNNQFTPACVLRDSFKL